MILKTVFETESISRAEIARVTKLTRTTVSEVVAGLLSEGLVREMGLSESIGGKPSILLSLVADSRYLIGLNLAQNKFIGAVVNLRGEIKKTIEIPIKDEDGEVALKQVYQILDNLLKEQWKPIVGIGVGAPGLINTRDGVVLQAVNLDWQNVPLGHLLQQRYNLPVSVMNDSQATAIGEFVYGDHGSDSNLIVVNVRRGIGAGILINGRIFQGDGGAAGEIGHVLAQENGLLCRCGRRGCLETVASAQAMLLRAQSLSTPNEFLTLDELETKFFEGNAIARQAVLEAGRYLGTSLGSLVGTLNIKKIVLTGDITCFGQPWLDSVQQAMVQAALGRMVQETELRSGKLDYAACILGAAAHLLLDGYSLLFKRES